MLILSESRFELVIIFSILFSMIGVCVVIIIGAIITIASINKILKDENDTLNTNKICKVLVISSVTLFILSKYILLGAGLRQSRPAHL